MSVAGAIDAPLDIFGGLVTDMAPADLPAGVSPDCADVAFIQGGVTTRPGLLSVYSALANNPTVNYLKTYITLNQTLRLLLLDSNGILYKEISPGTLAQVASALAANSYAKSTTLFGREYIAISDGKVGNDMPRQFDDTNFDRVSQVGPGSGPQPADTVANISSIARSANVVTVTTATAHNLLSSDQAVIAGVTDASFNGTFAVASILSSTQFTYNQTGANASSSGGTANPLGNIPAGAHKVAVIFKTRQGYLTQPSPAVAWTAAGNRRVTVSQIPTGPANVVARILCFTSAGGASFYYVGSGATLLQGNMILADNSSTSLVTDFSDAILLAATNVDYLFRLVELGACQGVIDYASRLLWWGERTKQNNWLNLTFDGGFDLAGSGAPLGWTKDATFGGGATQDTTLAAWGHAYRIVADGASATRGLLTQGAAKDSNGVPLISPNVDYSVRARVRRSAGLTQGTLNIDLFSGPVASGARRGQPRRWRLPLRPRPIQLRLRMMKSAGQGISAYPAPAIQDPSILIPSLSF